MNSLIFQTTMRVNSFCDMVLSPWWSVSHITGLQNTYSRRSLKLRAGITKIAARTDLPPTKLKHTKERHSYQLCFCTSDCKLPHGLCQVFTVRMEEAATWEGADTETPEREVHMPCSIDGVADVNLSMCLFIHSTLLWVCRYSDKHTDWGSVLFQASSGNLGTDLLCIKKNYGTWCITSVGHKQQKTPSYNGIQAPWKQGASSVLLLFNWAPGVLSGLC